MKTETPPTVFLRDYAPTPYLIDSVELTVTLDPVATRVTSRLTIRRNPASEAVGAALRLDGELLTLESVAVNGEKLGEDRYGVTNAALVLHRVPTGPFVVDIVNTCNPVANTALSGLYMSNGIYCTQCEAEGFRRITFFYDRPDVMARYRVRIEAPIDGFPVLLSNGNLTAKGSCGDDRHFAEWSDPHPKPTYLFALVAGDLEILNDEFITASGRRVNLGIHVERGKHNQCAWAMDSLKQSMRWDETRFGLKYDLDVFNIVAVPHFNMGAMENKGLNIFNDKYILATPDTATDADYANIESIVAHEYFHNWTGNRITCRDWFQLCLKEGLTVYRDQEFTSDLRSRAVKRIEDVKKLRARQFPEDAGPLAHPVRPSSYMEINNFYTPTVYEKGAELCRMIETLVGTTAFRAGMDLYVKRHDGQAATVEDFVRSMADASGRDLAQFFRWYEQAGTPRVTAAGHYDEAHATYTLTLEQHTAQTPGQPQKPPLHIPLAIGLLDPHGNDMPLELKGSGPLDRPLIELTEARQTFVFRNIPHRPALSLNRGFTSPIRLDASLADETMLFLMVHDSDSFNRWEATQALGRDLIIAAYSNTVTNDQITAFASALRRVLAEPKIDMAAKALMLTLPSEAEAAAFIEGDVDADALHAARTSIRRLLGQSLQPALDEVVADTADTGPYAPDGPGTGQRALRMAALSLLIFTDAEHAPRRIAAAAETAANMTSEFGALSILTQVDHPVRDTALAAFLSRHRGNALLVDKWLMLNAMCAGKGVAQRVERLTSHPDFNWAIPNRVYALISTFMSSNQAGFHAGDGEGYRVAADAVLKLDAINPQVAARVAGGFRNFRLFDETRRKWASIQLERILAESTLSKDVFEIVSRIATPSGGKS